MASKNRKITKNKQVDKTKALLSILVIVLITISTVLSVYIYQTRQTRQSIETASNVAWGPYVNLGLLQFNIKDGQGTLRNDSDFNKMKAFLEEESANSRCGVSGSAGRGYFNIIASTSDQKQLLLAYGCVQAGAQMYAVNINDEWKTISPTNKFDTFGIPDCDYLTENNISPEIAPVCANGFDSTTGLITGNPKYLNR